MYCYKREVTRLSSLLEPTLALKAGGRNENNTRACIPRPIRLKAFLKAWSLPAHSKFVLYLVLKVS